MKQIFLSIAIALTAIVATAQTNALRAPANYEAANWKIWLLDNPQQITVTAPPSIVQSKTELQSVKQRVAKLDEKKLTEIKYWNAGAPSYRWNQIAINVMTWDKPDVLLRTPQAWMDIAIYEKIRNRMNV